MRTIARTYGIIITAMIILLLAMPAFAGEKDAPNETLSKYIKTQLSFPRALASQKLEEKVRVDFRLRQDGTFEVVHIYTRNTEPKAHIKDQFSRMHITLADPDTESVYRVNVKYKVL